MMFFMENSSVSLPRFRFPLTIFFQNTTNSYRVVMSGKKGETIYRRPKTGYEERDPDNWEDFIVCDAYDKAVGIDGSSKNLLKDKGQQKLWQEHNAPNTSGKSTEHHSISTQHKSAYPEESTNVTSKFEYSPGSHVNKARQTSPGGVDARRWKPGDKCIALYNGDGLYYNSKIISVNGAAGSCLVEFDGYGNREVVDIDDVRSEGECTRGSGDAATSNSSSYTSMGSLSSTDGTSSDVTQDIYQNRARKKKRVSESKHSNFNNLRTMADPNFNPLIAMPPPVFMPQGFQQPFANCTDGSLQGRTNKPKDLTDDALSSMLMSWYMAGYHTGYYQGVSSKSKRNKR